MIPKLQRSKLFQFAPFVAWALLASPAKAAVLATFSFSFECPSSSNSAEGGFIGGQTEIFATNAPWLSGASLLGSGTILGEHHVGAPLLDPGNSPLTLLSDGFTYSPGSDWNLIIDPNLATNWNPGTDWDASYNPGFATYRDPAIFSIIEGGALGTISIQTIPEPSGLSLICLFAGYLLIRRRKITIHSK